VKGVESMKRNIYAVVAILISVLIALNVAACRTKGRYDDLKEYLRDLIAANEEYLQAVERAGNVNEMVKAINEMTEKSADLAKRAENIKKQYPNLTEISKNPPPELKGEYARLNALAERLLGITGKIMKYMMDPAVMEATQKMAEESRKTGVFQ